MAVQGGKIQTYRNLAAKLGNFKKDIVKSKYAILGSDAMHMNKICFLAIMLVVSPNVKCFAENSTSLNILYKLFDTHSTDDAIVSKLGIGVSSVEKVAMTFKKKRTYYFEKEKVWIQFRMNCAGNKRANCDVRQILISRKSLSKKKPSFKPGGAFAQIVNEVKIGDTSNRIILKYGTPSVVIKPAKDKTFSALREDFGLKNGEIVRYLPGKIDELFLVEFYFDLDGLNSALISCDE